MLNTVVDSAFELGQDSSPEGLPRVLSATAMDGSAALQAKVAVGTWKALLEQIRQLVQLTEMISNVSLFSSD